MKVLVCGDRHWQDRALIAHELASLAGEAEYRVLVHGDATGADRLAGEIGEATGWVVHPYPADWSQGRRAGPLRNQQMLDEEWPDLVLAFHADIEHSKGTKDMVQRAGRAGVPVQVVGQKAIAAFYARLEPELTNVDLTNRATNAVRVCLDALVAGDTALATKALDRLRERWEQRDQRSPAVPVWGWVQRHKQVSAIVDAMPDGWVAEGAAWELWYTTLGRASGQDREQAAAFAWEKARALMEEGRDA